MATVRKALPEDFEKNYTLLKKLNNTTLKRVDWEKFFKNFWNNLEEHCGHVLIEADNIVGYLGTLFNIRKSQGQNYNVCNVTSWIVEKEYRKQSFLLLLPLLSLKKYNITINYNKFWYTLYDRNQGQKEKCCCSVNTFL